MRAYDIISKKRDKKSLTKDEIEFFINGCAKGTIPDYQTTALLMAVYLNGMNAVETTHLTLAMADSGEKFDLSSVKGVKVDKHSTGGVGDKTTLIVAPVVAACGIPFAKMSGRGLGHTGGTIDKLESIPGFTTELTTAQFLENVNNIGVSIAGQTGNIAPADKKLYSLRDVTATVNCLPLIASSIMSKKIAGGADKILLDVKTGSGSFMRTMEESIALAKEMVRLGEDLGKETIAMVTDMEQPLGNAVGNSIEVIEAIESLKGRGPQDLKNICINIAVSIVIMALGCREIEAKSMVLNALSDKKALLKFKELITAQGGDPGIIDDYSLFKQPVITYNYHAPFGGYINSMAADKIGAAAMLLGAGRDKKEDRIDSSAGIYLRKKTGDPVEKDEIIASFYTDKKDVIDQVVEMFGLAVSYTNQAQGPRPMILAKVDKNGSILCT